MAKRASKKAKEKKDRFGLKDRNVKMFLVVVAGLVALFLISYWIFNGIGKINYKGLVFTKEMAGEIPVYHYYYYFDDDSGKQYRYNLYLRMDPSKNEVPIISNILFSKDRTNYLSVNSEGLTNCSDSSIGIAQLAAFLTDNQIKIKGATPNMAIAIKQNITYADCTTFQNDTTILIGASDKTQITQIGNCYDIEISNCEVLNAIEKFEVQTILDAKERAAQTK